MTDTLLEQILAELKAVREAADQDTLMNAGSASHHCKMSEHVFNKFVKAGEGPQFYDVPTGRMYTKRMLTFWLNAKFLRQIEWQKKYIRSQRSEVRGQKVSLPAEVICTQAGRAA